MPPIIVALEFVIIVLVAAFSGAVAGFGPHVRFNDVRTRHHLVLFTATGVWTAPLVILLIERSALAGLIGGGIVIAGFSILGMSKEKEGAAADRQQALASSHSFSQLEDISRFSRQLALAIVAVAAVQAAVLANLVDERELALFLFVLGAAVLGTQLPGGWDVTPPRRLLSRTGARVSVSMACATAMVLVGLMPFIASARGDRSLAALLRSLFARKAGGPMVRSHALRIYQTPIRSDGYIGVILTPKRAPYATSNPPQLTLNTKIPGLKNPLRIPFTGSYWFFQDPFVRPPWDSITAEGDPAKVGVRSSNYKPLQMEAVQTLEEPIETRYLVKIELALLDADLRPGTISVELVLADTRAWGRPTQSLGIKPMGGGLSLVGARNSHNETESFLVPLHSRLESFNQIRLIFRLDPSRNRQAAAIAIESFSLVPRTM